MAGNTLNIPDPDDSGDGDIITLLSAVTATGTGGAHDAGRIRSEVGVQVETTGSPTFSVQLQVSLDEVNWVNAGSAITSVTAETVVTGIVARYFRAVLATLSGGTLTMKIGVGGY